MSDASNARKRGAGGSASTPPNDSRRCDRIRLWTIDFEFDESTDLRQLKIANIVDEYTREALVIRVGQHCTAEDLITELERPVAIQGIPSSLRCDNGPELIANALRDWCRFARIGISYIYIEPGSPWENAYVESFSGCVRDELLNIGEFGSLLEAQVIVEALRIKYTYRPHGTLRGLTPTETRAAWITDQPTPS